MSNSRVETSKIQELIFSAIKRKQLGILKLFVTNNYEVQAALSRQSLDANIKKQELVHLYYKQHITPLWQEETLLNYLRTVLESFEKTIKNFLESNDRNETKLINDLKETRREQEKILFEGSLQTVLNRDEGTEIIWQGCTLILKKEKKSKKFILSPPNDLELRYTINFGNENKKYEEVKVAGYGNSGLIALNLNKNEFIKKLLEAVNSSENRAKLAREIKPVLLELSFKCNRYALSPIERPAADRLLSFEWVKLYNHQQSLLKNLEKIVSKIKAQFYSYPEGKKEKISAFSPEELAKWVSKQSFLPEKAKSKLPQLIACIEAVQAQERLIDAYCAQLTTCQEYIHEYAEPDSHLWVGKISLHLYAVVMNRMLGIFDYSKDNALVIDGEFSYISPHSNSTPICLVYNAQGHFNVLEEIREKKDDPEKLGEMYINWFREEYEKGMAPFVEMPPASWKEFYEKLSESRTKLESRIEILINEKSHKTDLLHESTLKIESFLSYQDQKQKQWGALTTTEKDAIIENFKWTLDEKSLLHRVESIALPPDFSSNEGNSLLHAAIFFNFDEAIKFLIAQGANILKPNSTGNSPLTLSTKRFAFKSENTEQEKALCYELWKKVEKLKPQTIDSKYPSLKKLSTLFAKLLKDLAEYGKIQQERDKGSFFYQAILSVANLIFGSDKTGSRFLTIGKVYTLSEVLRTEHDYTNYLNELDVLINKMKKEGYTRTSELYKRLNTFSTEAHLVIGENARAYQQDYIRYREDKAKEPEIAKTAALRVEAERQENIQTRRRDISLKAAQIKNPTEQSGKTTNKNLVSKIEALEKGILVERERLKVETAQQTIEVQQKLTEERERSKIELEQKLATERERSKMEMEQKLAEEREHSKIETTKKLAQQTAELERSKIETNQKLAEQAEKQAVLEQQIAFLMKQLSHVQNKPQETHSELEQSPRSSPRLFS